MKKIFTILLSTLCLNLFAQAPQMFNFQAILRDNAGATLGNKDIPEITITIAPLPNPNGVYYTEKHINVKTSLVGLFILKIGSGAPQLGSINFASIPWGSGRWDMRVQTGSPINFDITTQLLSVPYALYAEKSGAQSVAVSSPLTGDGSTSRPISIAQQNATAGQVLQWNGSAWIPGSIPISGGDNWGTQSVVVSPVLSGNGTSNSPLSIAQQNATDGQVLKWSQVQSKWIPQADNTGGTGGGDNWGTQTVVASSSLSGNGTANTPLSIAQQNATTGQVLKWNGSSWIPATDDTGNGGIVYSAGNGISISGNSISNTGDLSNTNELQNLSISGNTLSISNGNSVTLPISGGNYTAGSGISITGNVITNTGDNDNSATNELQSLSISGNTLSISNGNNVPLPIPTSLPPNGSAGGDLSGSYPNPTVAKIQGKSISSTAPTNGQVLVYNGATQLWEPRAAGVSLDYATKTQVGFHQTITRSASNWFSLVQAPIQLTAPSTGTYLVLARLRAHDFTNTDKIYIGVSDAISDALLATSFLFAEQNSFASSLGDDAKTAFWTINLTGGQTINLVAKLSGSSSSPVVFEDGELTIIRIK